MKSSHRGEKNWSWRPLQVMNLSSTHLGLPARGQPQHEEEDEPVQFVVQVTAGRGQVGRAEQVEGTRRRLEVGVEAEHHAGLEDRLAPERRLIEAQQLAEVRHEVGPPLAQLRPVRRGQVGPRGLVGGHAQLEGEVGVLRRDHE